MKTLYGHRRLHTVDNSFVEATQCDVKQQSETVPAAAHLQEDPAHFSET